MRVALVAPCSLGPEANPGWHMITAGIRALVRRAVPDAAFLMVDMLHDNGVHWAAAATCDAAILCGNPRFTLSDDAWWEGGIWDRLLQMQVAGVRVIDGWSGASFRLCEDRALEDMASEIGDLPRNVERLKYAKAITGRITRDPLMQRIYERAGIASTMLPCSSYWARDEFHTPRPPTRERNAIAITDLSGRPGVVAALRAVRADMQTRLPTDLLASTWGDYLWAIGEGFDDVELVNDPATLLARYAGYAEFLSFRIHAAIPAASMGCHVHAVAIDTRTLTCEPFGIPVTSLADFGRGPLEFGVPHRLSPAAITQTLKEMLC